MRTLPVACWVVMAALGCNQTQAPSIGCKTDADCFPLHDGCPVVYCVKGQCLGIPQATCDMAVAAPPDLTIDPCGSRASGSQYTCTALTGRCPAPGLSCGCQDATRVVCQADSTWERFDGALACPQLKAGETFEGRGCLGGAKICGDCLCGAGTAYHCGGDFGVPALPDGAP